MEGDGKRFAKIMDNLIEKKPDADINDFFDAIGIPVKNRSDYAFGEILRMIKAEGA